MGWGMGDVSRFGGSQRGAIHFNLPNSGASQTHTPGSAKLQQGPLGSRPTSTNISEQQRQESKDYATQANP